VFHNRGQRSVGAEEFSTSGLRGRGGLAIIVTE